MVGMKEFKNLMRETFPNYKEIRRKAKIAALLWREPRPKLPPGGAKCHKIKPTAPD
jgi:hypothetical protein